MHPSPVLDLLDRDEAIRFISVSPFSSSLQGYSTVGTDIAVGPYTSDYSLVVVPHPISGRYSNRVNFSCF